MQGTEQDRTASIIQVQFAPLQVKICLFLKVGSAVIGCGAHVTVVAPVDNACEFVKHL